MDAVILAGGKGQRLKGVVQPFFKPLIEVNAKPLLTHAIEYALTLGADHVVVVASRSNYEAISSIVPGSYCTVIVQEEPRGPGHATLLGARVTSSSRMALLMSDNIIEDSGLREMAKLGGTMDAVGVTYVPVENAERFTRLAFAGNGISFREGGHVRADEIRGDEVAVWCGPIIGNREKFVLVLSQACNVATDEVKIGPHLNEILHHPLTVRMRSIDVGTVSAYFEIENTNGVQR